MHFQRSHRVHRQDPFREVDGFSTMDNLFPHCRTLRWRPSGPRASVYRSLSHDGLCANYPPRKPPRHRGGAFGAVGQVVPYGHPLPRATFHAGRRQRTPGLTHLRRVRAAADRAGSQALRRRGVGTGSVEHSVRAGFDHHRSLPVAVSLCSKNSIQQGLSRHRPRTGRRIDFLAVKFIRALIGHDDLPRFDHGCAPWQPRGHVAPIIALSPPLPGRWRQRELGNFQSALLRRITSVLTPALAPLPTAKSTPQLTDKTDLTHLGYCAIIDCNTNLTPGNQQVTF